MDGGAWGDELGPHCHEETVESVYRLFALNLNLAAVESSTKLYLLITIKQQKMSDLSDISVCTCIVSIFRERDKSAEIICIHPACKKNDSVCVKTFLHFAQIASNPAASTPNLVH